MKNTTRILFGLFLGLGSIALFANTVEPTFGTVETVASKDYVLLIEGYDWGPGVNKVVLTMDKVVSEVDFNDFSVSVERQADGVEMQPAEAKGSRTVVHSYVSDNLGQAVTKGKYVTLVLWVSPNDPLSSPIKYIFKNGRGSNKWIDYRLTITQGSTKAFWNKETDRIIRPLVNFNLDGVYTQSETRLTYGAYVPKRSGGGAPLIIWLHGGGEGGADPSIPLIANKAWNYASKDIQSIFGGAHVLVPQAPTFWMQSANGDYTRGATNDIYNEVLMGLIKDYVAAHPDIDTDRIYVGGCSNGGYMSLKLILEHPDYFAAAYISALAYHNQYITDAQVARIKNVPIWFVHSKDDPVTLPDETVVPLYQRLVDAGAPNVHFSYYDHVTDLSGFFGGEGYRYNGHWSWVYSHANHANFNLDGSPVLIDGRQVTLMEWMAEQRN